jgi:hypothetical protein
MAPFFVKLTHSAIFFVLNICAIYLHYVKKPECPTACRSAAEIYPLLEDPACRRCRLRCGAAESFMELLEVGGEYRLNIFFRWLKRRIFFEFGTPEFLYSSGVQN